ncbi:MAG: Mg2+ and Co2+ transporter CorB [Cellulosilyticum sp.]|nr:Mg2+ and Co2+ transporter CorB [Cellulosilyticum sp.]
MAKRIKFKQVKVKKQSAKTLLLITGITFVIAMLFSYIFEVLLADVPLLVAFFLLIGIIVVGIIFDGMGNAVVAVDEVSFHSMAASKVKGAKESITLIRNAPMVANLFNDVIGDICGIISGSTATAIVLSLETGFGIQSVLLSIAMSGFVAAVTIGGKAVGKSFAIARARYIVYYVGIVIYYMKRVFGRLKTNKK